MNKITFEQLREANLKRLPQFKNKHGEPAHSQPDGSDWSIDRWFKAVVGEIGEFANWSKKYDRGDITAEEFLEHAAKELADWTIYTDILAYRIGMEFQRKGLDLGECVQNKFNEVSKRIGCDIFIGSDEITHYGVFRKHVPDSPAIKEASLFIDQGGLIEDWGKNWEPIRGCKTIGDARRKFAASYKVKLSHIYLGET